MEKGHPVEEETGILAQMEEVLPMEQEMGDVAQTKEDAAATSSNSSTLVGFVNYNSLAGEGCSWGACQHRGDPANAEQGGGCTSYWWCLVHGFIFQQHARVSIVVALRS